MGIKYEDIKQANDTIKTTDIKGKAYSEVPQRIKAFRMVYPEGFIISDMVSNENGVCMFRTRVGYYAEDGHEVILGTGTAYEKEDSSFINRTSYIENCETSSCGRALGMCGFGIDVSVASAEEVQNAIANQGQETKTEQTKTEQRKATPKQVEFLASKYKGENLKKLLEMNHIDKLEDITIEVASDLISKIKGGNKNE